MTIAPLQAETILTRLMELRQLQCWIALRLKPFDGAFVSLANGAGAEPTKHHMAKEGGLAIVPFHFKQAGAQRSANFNWCHGSPHCMSSPLALISLVISLVSPVFVGAVGVVIALAMVLAIVSGGVIAVAIVAALVVASIGLVVATISLGTSAA